MQRIVSFFRDSRVLSAIGFLALAAFILLAADTLQLALMWALGAILIILLISLIVWAVKKWHARKAAQGLSEVLEGQAEKMAANAPADKRGEVEQLRQRMVEAIKTIKQSRMGLVSGNAALYELPWYIIIGNPAAGKSTAIVNSGLKFPFEDSNDIVIRGVGGTRNCDWFFSTEGILLDTAGRYSIHDEDREEWLGFLGLLKRHRPLAPVNGVVVTVSLAELAKNPPEFTITLAKNLRQRVQELLDKLEIYAPVYVLFTKADLIAGFTEFFDDMDEVERARVWGASFPYRPGVKTDVVGVFEQHFDTLYMGLREKSIAQMSLARGAPMQPGLLSFPLEFASLKPNLTSFIATLFEDNPFQYRPIFRGFYFTSAVQQGTANSASIARLCEQFELASPAKDLDALPSQEGFFLKDLFSKVIFADKNTVKRPGGGRKLAWRYATFFAFMLSLGALLSAWTWALMGNRQLMQNVDADIQKVVRLQQERVDLQSRLEALGILQDRIDQLERYGQSRPMALGMGLYQGEKIAAKLRVEYFKGLEELMLKPVAQRIEAYLSEVNRQADKLQPMTRPPQSATKNLSAESSNTYQEAAPDNVEDAYNALKTYLMLADKSHLDVGHLTDQITRFWRTWLETNRGDMPRETMIRQAERTLSFALARTQDPLWPMVAQNYSLVDQARENLRKVVRGMPARERVYADIKARAATRFPPVTVASIVGEEGASLLQGSYAISGAFTKEAWLKYVEPAIKNAANAELQSSDWVLKTAARDDLTLEGSPEQIQKGLVKLYKEEYTREWKRFVQGIAVKEFARFDQAVEAMTRLGDPRNSPLGKLVQNLYDQTSWDNPSALNSGIEQAQSGFIAWFKQTILRQTPASVEVKVDVNSPNLNLARGPIGTEFAGLARIVVTRDRDKSLLADYLQSLSRLRTRLHTIKNQGDVGPGARTLVQQTLEGGQSELSDALRLVDEQMMVGMQDAERNTLRPILVRPLIQTFKLALQPAQIDINKIWNAQVYEVFQGGLASKYPFNASSHIEASASEMAQIFGADGAIAKFVNTTLAPLIVRRGDLLAPKTWGDLGITLKPEFTTGFASWVAPLAGGAAPTAGGSAAASANSPQTFFQIKPQAVPGLTEYTIEIDGQLLRYRNTPPQWQDFFWPNAQGTPGAKVTALTFDGRSVEIFNFPGHFGLEKMINSAQRKRNPDGSFDLSWTTSDVNVHINLRIISNNNSANKAAQGGRAKGASSLPVTIVVPDGVEDKSSTPAATPPNPPTTSQKGA